MVRPRRSPTADFPAIPWLAARPPRPGLTEQEACRAARTLGPPPSVAQILAFHAFPVLATLAATAIAAHGLHAPLVRGSLPALGRPSGETSEALRAGDGEMSRMRSLVAGAVAMAGAASAAHAQDAVQWRVEDGGNGHWYRVEVEPAPVEWSSAREAALAMGADLAEIRSPAAVQFVFQLTVLKAGAWIPFGNSWLGPWLGGRQAVGASEPYGGWTWTDGTAIDLAVARADMNNSGGCGVNEDRLSFWKASSPPIMSTTTDFATSDFPDRGFCEPQYPSAVSYVIEWSADCNADGIVDYGQIRSGELDDANANNIPDCCELGATCGCAADLDGNGSVDGIDLAVILNRWGTDGGKDYPNADIDGNGTIDGADLAQILSSWGPCS